MNRKPISIGIGIDMAKRKSDYCVITPAGKVHTSALASLLRYDLLGGD